MKRLRWILPAAVILLTSLLWGNDDAPKPHKLPDDPKTPVIVFDWTGGMIRPTGLKPVLRIFPDGSSVAADPFGSGKSVKAKLAADELQSLLDFILLDMRFNDITPTDLQPAGNVRVTDGVTTTVTVEADGHRHQCSAYALETVVAGAGPDSPAARFLKIDNRLQMLDRVVTLGGPASVRKNLDAANAKLKTDLPDEPMLTPADLASARLLKESGTLATFTRKTTRANGKWHILTAVVADDGKGDLTVQLAKGSEQ